MMYDVRGEKKKKKAVNFLPFSVIPRGFEPRTHSLEGCCSIQLSYETIIFMSKV